MTRRARCALLLSAVATLSGCRAEVQPTEDSQRISVEVPRVEVGDQPVDADPATDEDIDVDTPAPGDR